MKFLYTFILFLVTSINAQSFGQNKVQYRDFDWNFIQTPHFDIYYYGGEQDLAEFAADVAEESYEQISVHLRWDLKRRVSIMVYNSHNEFQQTNVVRTYMREGIGGVTELFKNRVVFPFEGNYTSWLEQKAGLLKQRDKTASSLQRKVDQELEWLRASPSARRKKNKSRISDYEKLVAQKVEIDENTLDIQIDSGPQLGEKVIETTGLTKGYNDNPLIKDLTFSIPRGAVVGLIGPNGTGKTTLFRMVIGEESPDAGKIEIGSSVKLSYVDQHRHDLDGDKTIFEEITGGTDQIEVGSRSINSRSYVGKFNFKGSDQQKKVANLSGGERNRVHLAKLLRRGGNVLLLDEPTNDLDVTTLRNLESAILNFSGCVLVISHDRFFLNRICTHLLVFEGESKVRWFEGNFEEYQEKRREELGGREENRRSKYKKLTIR